MVILKLEELSLRDLEELLLYRERDIELISNDFCQEWGFDEDNERMSCLLTKDERCISCKEEEIWLKLLNRMKELGGE